MENTIDELMNNIVDTIKDKPWPQVSPTELDQLIDYYRDLRASYEGGVAPRMKKAEAAPAIREKLKSLGMAKPKPSLLRRL